MARALHWLLPNEDRHYQWVIVSATVSNGGTSFYTMAAAILAFHLTGQVSASGTVFVWSLLPRLILLLVGGVIGDRYDRRDLLFRLDLLAAAVTLAPLFVVNASQLWILYATGFVLNVLSCIYRPSQSALVRQLAGPEHVQSAITDFNIWAQQLASIIGPLLAWPLLILIGPVEGFVVNALSFVASALIIGQVPRGKWSEGRTETVIGTLAGYVHILRRRPRVFSVCLASIGACVPIFYFQGIAVVYAVHLGQPSSFITVLFAVAAFGGLVGGLVVKVVPLTPKISAFCLIAAIPTWALLSYTSWAVVALLVVVVTTVFDNAGEIAFDVLIQKAVPDAEQARLASVFMWFYAIGQIAGVLIVTLIDTAQAVSGMAPVALGSTLLSLSALAPLFLASTVPIEHVLAEEEMHIVST